MKKMIGISLSTLLVVVFALAGCGAQPLEDPKALEANGFISSYHPYMWQRVSQSSTDYGTETSYQHTDSDAFFAVMRINADAAAEQGVSDAAGMEDLLTAYVQNYGGAREKITSADTDDEHVRRLTFEYNDADMAEKYTYLAKMTLQKASGELMVVLAAYPNSSNKLVKNEVQLVMDSAVLAEIEEQAGDA